MKVIVGLKDVSNRLRELANDNHHLMVDCILYGIVQDSTHFLSDDVDLTCKLTIDEYHDTVCHTLGLIYAKYGERLEIETWLELIENISLEILTILNESIPKPRKVVYLCYKLSGDNYVFSVPEVSNTH